MGGVRVRVRVRVRVGGAYFQTSLFPKIPLYFFFLGRTQSSYLVPPIILSSIGTGTSTLLHATLLYYFESFAYVQLILKCRSACLNRPSRSPKAHLVSRQTISSPPL